MTRFLAYFGAALVNITDASSGKTGLHYACQDGHATAVRILRLYPELCVDAVDADGCTAMDLAA